MTRTVYAHELVVQTAKDMAHAVYEEAMTKSNEFYRDWKARYGTGGEEKFVEWLYPKLLGDARATLATMLANKALAHLHEGIYDALVKDYPLHVARTQSERRIRLEQNEDGELVKVKKRH